MTKEEKLEDEICEYVHNHYKVAALGFSYRDLRDVAEHFALPKEKRIAELEQQIEKMKKYIKACWFEENLNDYSSYVTNTSDEFRDLVKELREEIRNGR
jgi:hypothetical protein